MDRSVNFRSTIILYRATWRTTVVRKGIADIFFAISEGASSGLLLPSDREQIKQFPNPLLISLTDDFVTRTIVGVTEPIDARNCLGRGVLWRFVATFPLPTDAGFDPMAKLTQAYDSLCSLWIFSSCEISIENIHAVRLVKRELIVWEKESHDFWEREKWEQH